MTKIESTFIVIHVSTKMIVFDYNKQITKYETGFLKMTVMLLSDTEICK